MAIANNIDEYANARLGIFFPGFPNSLTGQCVSSIKWFLGEMCGIGDWQAARGNAKDYGDALVNQGLAYVVAAGDRKPGDIVVWKQDGGGYGHIGNLLTGDRVFEGNVGLAGTPRAVYEGNVVYATRIDPLYANWRKGAPTFYRVRTYVENIQKVSDDVIIGTGDNWRWRMNRLHHQLVGNWDMGDDTWNAIKGQEVWRVIESWSDHNNANQLLEDQVIGERARVDNWPKQIYDLQALAADLDKRPTQAQLDTLNAKMTDLTNSKVLAQQEAQKAVEEARAAQAAAKVLADQAAADTEAGLSFWRRLGQALTKLLPGGK